MKKTAKPTTEKKKIEKLDLVKLRREMYKPIRFDWEHEELIREIVAREINIFELKINEIIERINEQT